MAESALEQQNNAAAVQRRTTRRREAVTGSPGEGHSGTARREPHAAFPSAHVMPGTGSVDPVTVDDAAEPVAELAEDPPASVIRLVLADDHAVVRAGLRLLLDA